MFRNNCPQSHAANCPRAYYILNRLQPCKLRSNPVTSHHFHWCSTDLNPDPSTFDTTSPRRSASLHPPDLHSIVADLVACEAKKCDGFVDAQGIGQDLEEMESRASRRWLMDDSWQNSKSQTSSNFWYLDWYLTSNLNQDFTCQQTACTLTPKETPRVSCIRSPPGLEVIITNFAANQIQLCDCLVHAQGISQGLRKNWSVNLNRLPDPFSWTRRRFWGNPVFAYNQMQLLQINFK